MPVDESGFRARRGGETPTVYVADTATARTTWTDNAPAPGDYVWIVKALFDGYPSPESNPASASVSGLPGPVRNLSAFMGSGGVTLIWEALEGDGQITGYRIRRGAARDSLQVLVDDTGSVATAYVDTAVTAGTRYYYTVAPLNGEAEGPPSAPVSIGSNALEVAGPASFTVAEGETAVGTLSATGVDTAVNLAWSIAGGADRAHFTVTNGRVARARRLHHHPSCWV